MVGGNKIGQWAFIVGILISVLVGFFPQELMGKATLLLVILGLVIGFLNVTEKETMPFLVASVALLTTATARDSLKVIPPMWVGSFLANAVASIAVFVVPAAIIVAIKAIWALAKD